jgi:type I restriction enzyme S subunit
MEKLLPQLRFPEFKGEWEEKKLGHISKISSGGTPSRANPKYWDGNIPWVSTAFIDFNNIVEATEYIANAGLANSSAKLFPKGTLLMAMYGQGRTRDKVALLGVAATTNLASRAIIPEKEKLDELFLLQHLPGRYDGIRDLSNQGGQENLSGGIIKSILVNLPSLPEQTKIATFVTTVDEKLNALKQKNPF